MPERIYVYHIKGLREKLGVVGRWVGVVLDEIPMLMRRQFVLYLDKKDMKYGLCVVGEGDLKNYWIVIMARDGRERRKVRSVLHYYGFVKYELKDFLFVDKEIEGMKPYKVLKRGRDDVYVE